MRENLPNSVISILFAALIVGLIYTQVIRYPYYKELSRNNAIRIIPIEGPRGNIFDRKQVPMVTNRLSFDAALCYQEISSRTRLARALGDILGMPKPEIIKALVRAGARPYEPVAVAEDISPEKAFELEEAGSDMNGLVIQTRPRRSYLYGRSGSHVFGYLSEIGRDELEELKDYGYRMKDLLGRSGIEKSYNDYLRGTDGGTQVLVDNRGVQTRVLGMKEPVPGRDLYLTIDAGLQEACDKLLAEHAGAVIAMDPKTGEVLALASHPSFDPNVFVKPEDSEERMKLLNDKIGRPMSDRAISGLYPPGSVFKMVTTSAALQTRKITPSTRFFCAGSYKLGRATFDCWKEGGHGSQCLREGIMNSCNVYFYNIGRAAGADALEYYANLFGFGRPTGIDLPDEVKGLVPGRSWKRARKQQAWYEGETLNYAIGQGYLMVTPIQVLDMTAAVANGGYLVRPHVVKRIDSTKVSGERRQLIGLRSETINSIRDGMREVVNNENGTGRRARLEGVTVAGKTGTAQNPLGATHAWFAGFAPYDDPKICVVVFLEHGGKGGISAAEIGGGIFKEAKALGYL